MTETQLEALVDHSPAEVWAVVTDLSRWDWRSDLARIEIVDAKTFLEIAKGGYSTTFTVTEREPPLCWAFAMENGNMRGQWRGTFTETEAGTHLVFTERVEAKKWWMRPFVKGYLKKQQSRYLADLQRALDANP